MGWKLAILLTALLLLSSCNTVGPQAVDGARVEYNSAIANSWNEQLLLNLVRMRYGEWPVFLEVSSLSTQYNLGFRAHVDPLITRPDRNITKRSLGSGGLSMSREKAPGSDDEFSNGIGFDYYERPTVTYSPLQGQDFVSRILSPITVESLILLLGSGWDSERVFRFCMQRVNGVENAPSASGPTPELAPDFENFDRAMELVGQLSSQGVLYPIIRKEEGVRHLYLEITPDARDDERVKEFRDLLNLPSASDRFLISTRWGVHTDAILEFHPRSLMGVLYYMSLAVTVPDEHLEKKWATETISPDGSAFDWSQALGDLIQIQSSTVAPRDAYVSVRYEGHWFYIAKSDRRSKVTFSFLTTLFYLQAGEAEYQGPILTLPLSQ
jgi:hypothetical protein